MAGNQAKKRKSQFFAASKKAADAFAGPVTWTPPDNYTPFERIVRNPWLLGVLLVAMVLIAYIPAMNAGMIWDDDVLLTNNPFIYLDWKNGLLNYWDLSRVILLQFRDYLDPNHLMKSFSTENPDYFPLTSTLFWIEYRFWGKDLAGFHTTNIVLHAINSLLLWRLLARLKIPGAWLAAAIFALHPVNVASVAWIAEKKNTLSMIFYLLTIGAWVKFEDAEPAQRRAAYLLAILMFMLSLLAKSTGVVLPPILLLIAWWRRNTITKKDILAVIPFFAMALIMGWLTMKYQYRESGGMPKDAVSGWHFLVGLAVAGRAVGFYIWKILWPFHLSAVYPRWPFEFATLKQEFLQFVEGNWDVVGQMLFEYYPSFLLGLLFLLLFLMRKRIWNRTAFFVLGYFVLSLAPLLGFFPTMFMQFSYVTDHWVYLSLPAISTALVAAVVIFVDRLSPEIRGAGPMVALVLLCGLGFLTWRQAETYKNHETLWKAVLRNNPSAWVAWNNYGSMLAGSGDRAKVEEAALYFQKALELNHGYADACHNLATTLAGLGRKDEAIRVYQQAILMRPDARSYICLGMLLDEKGAKLDAINCMQTALKWDPYNSDAHFKLGLLLDGQGRLVEALEHYRAAAALRGDKPEAFNNLGWYLATLPDPNLRNPQEALACAAHAVKLTNGDVNTLDTLGAAQAACGNFKEAVESATLALSRLPPPGAHPMADQQRAMIEHRLTLYRAGKPYIEDRKRVLAPPPAAAPQG